MTQCFLRQVYIKIDFGVNLDRRVCSKNNSTKGKGRKIWVLGFNDNSFLFFTVYLSDVPTVRSGGPFWGKKVFKVAPKNRLVAIRSGFMALAPSL